MHVTLFKQYLILGIEVAKLIEIRHMNVNNAATNIFAHTSLCSYLISLGDFLKNIFLPRISYKYVEGFNTYYQMPPQDV